MLLEVFASLESAMEIFSVFERSGYRFA